MLKLGLVNPLPRKLIEEFAAKVDRLYIFEELEPYLDSGLVAATIWQAPELQVQEAIRMLYDYIDGSPWENEVEYVKLGIVMKHNFRNYLIEK